ncbi:MAG: MBL fold metallo-hydrolase [Oscillospiraceae bacterium]|nr:MBL fold metallo-hydrolase [Oscillospiraceae bacterium]
MPEEIITNLYRLQIKLPNSPLKMLNSYLIKGEERNLLIDTGFNHIECRESLMGGLSELGVNMAETDIILTHLHADHTGLAPEIYVPGTRVFLSRKEIPWMIGEMRRELWKRDNARMLQSGFTPDSIGNGKTFSSSRGMASDPSFDKYLPIDEGDEFSCGGYTLRAVLTPGHTPAHMCFFMEKQKTMFTGDHVLFDISPNITLWQNVDDSLGDYLESLKKINRFDVDLALPGHRGTGDFHARVAELLEHHEKRLEECLEVVLNNPDSTIIDIAGKMTWRIRCNSWEDFPANQKWFAVGECHSHLRHLERRGKVEAYESGELIRYRAI